MPIVYLRKSRCELVPQEYGVYLVLRLDRSYPEFLEQSTGGHFKNQDPTVGLEVLEQEWVNGAIVVYIGNTGGIDKQSHLKQRLTQLIDFGAGKKVGHRGGRLLWQLADADHLVVCWKVLQEADPAMYKSGLIADFTHQYGQRPYANLIG